MASTYHQLGNHATANNNFTLRSNGDGSLSLGKGTAASFTELVKINADGSFEFVVAGNIKFPASQSASGDVNTLDDYEEGTTSPTITATSGTFTTVSCTLRYTKIGRLVTWQAQITITTAGTAAGQIILPMPFSPAAGTACIGMESAVTADTVAGFRSGDNMHILAHDGSTIIGDGRTIHLSGSFTV